MNSDALQVDSATIKAGPELPYWQNAGPCEKNSLPKLSAASENARVLALGSDDFFAKFCLRL